MTVVYVVTDEAGAKVFRPLGFVPNSKVRCLPSGIVCLAKEALGYQYMSPTYELLDLRHDEGRKRGRLKDNFTAILWVENCLNGVVYRHFGVVSNGKEDYAFSMSDEGEDLSLDPFPLQVPIELGQKKPRTRVLKEAGMFLRSYKAAMDKLGLSFRYGSVV